MCLFKWTFIFHKENFHFRFNPELLPQMSALDKANELIQQYKAKLKQLEMKGKVGFWFFRNGDTISKIIYTKERAFVVFLYLLLIINPNVRFMFPSWNKALKDSLIICDLLVSHLQLNLFLTHIVTVAGLLLFGAHIAYVFVYLKRERFAFLGPSLFVLRNKGTT